MNPSQFCFESPTRGVQALLMPNLFAVPEQTPVVVMEAGEDRLVRSDGNERFCRRVPHANRRVYQGAFHDLLDETDDIRCMLLLW